MIGDGYSDYCAARLADASFARAAMRDHCDANGVAYIPFEDFHDVLDAFSRGHTRRMGAGDRYAEKRQGLMHPVCVSCIVPVLAHEHGWV